jgi:large subunit ribosomal protein L17
MRHRKQGRTLGRSPSHRKALFRNMASALFLTERDAEFDDNAPKVKGRIITTLPKAKEARPLIERCITIAKKSLAHKAAAAQLATSAERNSAEWKQWRNSDAWQKWAQAQAPYVAARRRVFALLRDKQAVQVLFETIAPRYVDRPGGYTRILKLAKPRLGDAGQRAILELVGAPERDRVAKKSEKPAFSGE